MSQRQYSVIAAYAELDKANAALNAAIVEAFPVGMVLQAKLGGHWITVRVTDHRYDEILAENIHTGKLRRFTPRYTEINIP